MERLRCRPIVHITVNTEHPHRMNTSSIWRGTKRKRREREGGVRGRRKGTDIEGVYQAIGELSPMNSSLSEKIHRIGRTTLQYPVNSKPQL